MDLATETGQRVYRRVLVDNGAAFYGLPVPRQQMTLSREDNRVEPVATPLGDIVPLPAGVGPGCPEGRGDLMWRLEV